MAGRKSARTALSVASKIALLALGLGATVTGVLPASAATSPTVVSLTFDNAWEDQMTAFDDMQAASLQGTFYVPAAFIGAGGSCDTSPTCFLTLSQLQSISAAGDEIGGKTVDNTDLTLVPASEAEAEVCQGRDDLIADGFDVTDFAYPFGDYTGTNGDVNSSDGFYPNDLAPGSSTNDEAIPAECGFNSARGVGNIIDVQPDGCPSTECSAYAESLPGGDQSGTTLDDYGINTPSDAEAPDETSTCPTLSSSEKPAVALSTSAGACELEEDVINAENHNGGWLAFSFHQICTTSTSGCSSIYSFDPTDFEDFVTWLAAEEKADSDIKVETVQQVIGGTEAATVPQCTTTTTGCYPAVSTPVAAGAQALTDPLLNSTTFLPPCPEVTGGGTTCSPNYPSPTVPPTLVPATPACWTNDDASGTDTFTYDATPSPAVPGGGGEVTVTGKEGDGLLGTFDLGQCAPAVTQGDSYTLSTYYASNVAPYYDVYVRFPDGTWQYWTSSPTTGFAANSSSTTPPSAPTWSEASWVTPPVGSVTETSTGASEPITALAFSLVLPGSGWLSTSDYSMVNDGSSGVVVSGPANATTGPVTYDVTVSAPSGGTLVPTGSVSISDGTNTCSVASLTAVSTPPGYYESAGSCAIDENAGTYAVTATYTSTNGYPTVSGATTETVAKATPSVVVTSTDNPGVTGPVPYQVTVDGPTGATAPTGSATVSDGKGGTCSAALSSTSGSSDATGSCSISEQAADSPYSVTAAYGGDSNYNGVTSSAFSETVDPASQTIQFTSIEPTNASYGGSTYVVTATASSGLPVTLTIPSTSSTVCALSGPTSGSTVSFIGAGTCVIDANQPGNANYTAAGEVTQSFTVSESGQTITISSAAPTNAYYKGPSYTVVASSSSGLPVTLTIPSTSSTVCAISGSTVSFIGVGSCTIDANQAGNSDYLPATQVTQSFSVNQAPQAVMFTTSPPSPAEVGGTYTPSATATSGLAVTFSIASTTSSVCEISGGTVTFLATGTCTIDATQPGNADYLAGSNSQSFDVNPKTLTITASSPTIYYGQGIPQITPEYSGFTGGDTVSSLTTLPTCYTTATSSSNAGTYETWCSGAQDPNYLIVYVNGSLTIKQAPTALATQQATQTLEIAYKLLSFSAGLTSTITKAGIPGQTVVFSLSGQPECQAQTSQNGTATCSAQVGLLSSVPSTYTATFSGATNYLSTSASGSVSPNLSILGLFSIPALDLASPNQTLSIPTSGQAKFGKSLTVADLLNLLSGGK